MLLSVSLVLLMAVVDDPPTCATRDVRVEHLISAKTQQLGAEEHCQFRLYETLSDVDGDRREDFLVIFQIEGEDGGHNSTQFLAVFPTSMTWKPSLTEVGRRGQRQVTALHVESGIIVLHVLDAGPDDAMCCPSVQGEARLRFAKGTILPVAPARPPAK